MCLRNIFTNSCNLKHICLTNIYLFIHNLFKKKRRGKMLEHRYNNNLQRPILILPYPYRSSSRKRKYAHSITIDWYIYCYKIEFSCSISFYQSCLVVDLGCLVGQVTLGCLIVFFFFSCVNMWSLLYLRTINHTLS